MPPHPRTLFALLTLLWSLPGLAGAGDPAPRAEDERLLREAKLDSDGPALLAYLASQTLTPELRGRARGLIRRLGSDDYEERQQATAELDGLGPVVLSLLEEARTDPDLEIRRRANRLRESLLRRRNLALLEAVLGTVAVRAPTGSTAALLDYLPSTLSEDEVPAVRSALLRVAIHDGVPDPALVAGLRHPHPLSRGVAAEVFASANREYRRAVRPLLVDPEPAVRLRAGLGMVLARERVAVPVLIDLVAELPANQLGQAEEILFRLAGDAPPPLPSDETATQRLKRRDAWRAWWEKDGGTVDLARLDPESQLGYLMAVTFHGGGVRVSEFGADGRARWAINGLNNAVDACVVAGNHVLIAEYGASRVTERTFDNKIVWERNLRVPVILCQRLANGNTFIVSTSGFVEVDRNGREVATRTGMSLRAASKYRDGRIGLVTSSGEYVRLDRTGRTEKQFPTGVQIGNTLGGIDFLPDGGLLVGRPDRVVQLDPQGKEVWAVKVTRPYGATRLASGNTLVACTATKEFLEFDRSGRVVRTLKVDGEPWLARRR